MVNTFFKTLTFLEKNLLQESDKKCSKDVSSLLRRLIKFVEAGSVVDSDVEKFILKNFRMTSADITTKWNEIHYDRVRSKDTIRSQVSVLNRYFSSLFDITATELNDAFVTEKADTLMRLSDILVAFDVGDFNIAERFPILQRYLPDDTTDSVYTVEECAAEINFLKTLDKSVIEKMLDEIDRDKLIYVLQSIRQPLLTSFYRKFEDKNSKQKLCSVNQDKVAFYKAFSIIKPKQLKPVECIEAPMKELAGVVEKDNTAEQLAGVVEKDNTAEQSVEVVDEDDTAEQLAGVVEEDDTSQEPEPGSSLQLSHCFEDILEKGLKRYQELSVERKLELSKASTADSKQRCKDFFKLFTEEGFKEYLNSLNIYDVVCELERLR